MPSYYTLEARKYKANCWEIVLLQWSAHAMKPSSNHTYAGLSALASFYQRLFSGSTEVGNA